MVDQPYWRLRDHVRAAPLRRKRQQALEAERERVKEVAFSHPTYGYRPVHQVLKSHGEAIGRERMRYLFKDLGLQQRRPKKTRRHAGAVTESVDFPLDAVCRLRPRG